MIGAPAFVILIIALIIYSKAIVPAVNYKRALADIESGDYSSAYSLFDLNPEYKDTPEKKKEAKIKEAKELIASKEYEAADEIYEEIYEDSADDEIINTLNQLVREKKYDAAISFAEYIDDYSKRNDYKDKCSYKYARELADQKKYEKAYTLMDEIGDYENAEELSKSYKYLHAKQLLAKKDYIGGYELLEKIEDYKDSKKLMEDNKFNYQLQTIKKAEVGDKVTFGTYEQDNDTTNGAEDMEWVVLKVSDNRIMLISDGIVDAKQFSSSSNNVNWENSSVRSWLNSDFYNTAFSTKEQGYIVSNDTTTETSTKETENQDEIIGDKVSLLTEEERKEFDVGTAKGTTYALSSDLERYTSGSYYYKSYDGSPYWLRTNDTEKPDQIMYYGKSSVNSDDPTELKGIVPVIWVEIK